ncbi:hypothetical protein M404DRAFT_346566 [Pisolithus tinctorius Marx 270]|uniref:Uncharacterized protein n=1 Tax=Pisolithus tinctorius Marx 270 TaxID=870435 RepID=A0A0C3PID5_PISTI|nr:hypothetical protein M404DRAFT_346566 [Pisolithus tinctorius Marx 270]
MPRGMKPAPPHQSSLSQMWGRSKAKESASNVGDSKPEVGEENVENSKPKRRAPVGDSPSPGPSTSKRRRVVHSDDEKDVKDEGPLHIPSVPGA